MMQQKVMEATGYLIASAYLWDRFRSSKEDVLTTLLGLSPLEHIAIAFLIGWAVAGLFKAKDKA